jgi:lipopolysaccharide/colanic/teichoic acid biosynthesis glycosyltransferase
LYKRFGKRALDVVLAGTVLLIGGPILAVISIVSRRTLGSDGSILFRQQRVGRNGQPFELVKFRTMRTPIEEVVDPLRDRERVTGFGAFLRSTSLDELPELLNILRGDMSLVGPRPLLTQYLPHYDRRQRRRHEVLPGLTGLAQTSGRNTLSWEEQFELDVEYVENLSFGLDVKILLRTIGEVIGRDQERAAAFETKPFFQGTGIRDTTD